MCVPESSGAAAHAPVPPRSHHPRLNPELPKTHHRQSLRLTLGPLGPPLLLRTQLTTFSQRDVLQPRCFAAALHRGWGPGSQSGPRSPAHPTRVTQEPSHVGTASQHPSAPLPAGCWAAKPGSPSAPKGLGFGGFFLNATCGNSTREERQQVSSSWLPLWWVLGTSSRLRKEKSPRGPGFGR